MIKTTPFINPFRSLAKKLGGDSKIVIYNGKKYEQVIKKKCQPKI